MRDPLEITFRVLATSANPAAVDLLVDALASADDRIRLLAAEALLNRRHTRGLLALVQVLETFSPEMRNRLIVNRQALEHALQQATVHGDPAMRQRGLMAIQWMEALELLPLLFTLLQDETHSERELIRQTITAVTQKLFDNVQADKNGVHGWWVSYQPIDRLVHNVLMYLDHALTTAPLTSGAEEAVQGLLILGNPDQEVVKRIFRHTDRHIREYAYEQLKTSRNAGMMRLTSAFLTQPFLPPVIFEVFAERDDLEFIIETLRTFPRKLNANQQKNLHAIEKLPWICEDLSLLKLIPAAWQATLIKWVSATGIPSEDKQHVVEWVMRFGGPEGKEAAAHLKNSLDQETLRSIVLDGLDSVEEEDQVWATRQLRSLAIPDTFRLLIDRLNSPLPSVRRAARDELQSFDLPMMLGKFETMDPETCHRAGQLLKKIDPNTPDALRREFAHPGARRRLRAIRGAFAMGLHGDIIEDLMMMLDDDDLIVRRTIVECLGAARHPEARDVLQRALRDPNLRIRRSAEIVLQQIEAKRAADAEHERTEEECRDEPAEGERSDVIAAGESTTTAP